MTMHFAASNSVSSKNRAAFMMLMLFLTGCFIGALLVRHFAVFGCVISGIQDYDGISAYLSRDFIQAFVSCGKFLVLLYLLSFQKWGAMMVPPVFGLEGLYFGAAVCSLISFMGLRGVVMAALLMLFRLVLVIPFGFILGCWSVEQSLQFPVPGDTGRKIGVLFITLVVMLLASFLECTLGRWLGGMYYLTFGV